MPVQISQVIIIVIAGTVLVLLLLVFLLVVFFIFQRRHLQHRQEKGELRAMHDLEILQSQIEVQNYTLQQIAQELHDNIGQLLSVAKINLNLLEESLVDPVDQIYVKQTNEIIGSVISDVRALTKSFDGDFVKDFGLEESILQELKRIEKTGKYEVELRTVGEKYSLGYEKDIIIFRIFQELMNNCLRHAYATKIVVQVSYNTDKLIFRLEDNGRGFEYKDHQVKSILQSGAGLRNVKRRIEMIKGEFLLVSEIGRGTIIDIIVPLYSN